MRKTFIILFLLFIASGFFFSYAVSSGDGNPVSLTRVCNEKGSGYSIAYPEGWTYQRQSAHIILFSRKEGKDKSIPVIGIQNLYSKEVKEGKYKDVNAVIEEFVGQLKTTKQAKVFYPEPFVYQRKNMKLMGQQFLAEYTYEGRNNKQWTVVIPRQGGEIFHVFIYSTPLAEYEKYSGTAKAMLDSWTIQE